MTDWLRYCNFLFLSTSNTMYYKDLNQAQQERMRERVFMTLAMLLKRMWEFCK